MIQASRAALFCEPDSAFLESVREVFERGQTVGALRSAESFAPLSKWGGVEACILAARIAANAGAPHLSLRLTLRMRQANPRDVRGLVQWGYEVLERRGALALWQLLRNESAGGQDASAEMRAELLALQGLAASDLRDFDTAERLLEQAQTLAPQTPWIRVASARMLERLDRVEEALEKAAAARALHKYPFYRPAVQTIAQLLQLLDRDDDAVQLLQEANAVLQSGPVAAQLFSLLSEQGRWPESEAALERYVELSPLLESKPRKWVASQRARVLYHLGRRAESKRFADSLDDDFHRAFAQRLAGPPQPVERVQLDVSFVRQHFKTCAPATMAALGRFWRMPAEHLSLAEKLCYDGTPHWQQRQWAEQNGWHVREFRVTKESAADLSERGIPFALSTVDATSAHMVAVIGFDRTRGTLLFRDPSQPYVVEIGVEWFLKRYRASGPHGMVFLPVAEIRRLEGVSLPDADAYDAHHQLNVALAEHNRARALELLRRMETDLTEHAVLWESKLSLAGYDANVSEQARCLDELLKLFPGNPALLLQRLNCLREETREERIGFLRPACSVKEADPALLVELARALMGDARSLASAQHALRRAFRLRPMESGAIGVQADLYWESGRFDEAAELYRFAANLEGFREHLYQTWFRACRRTRHAEEALVYLQGRWRRFGSRSEQPALTLAWAWREMEQPQRAREVLSETVLRHPKEGVLLLRLASLEAGLGNNGEARARLEAARGKIRQNDWLRAAIEIEEANLETATALRWARELLEIEPLALDAHGGVARAVARIESPAAALDHLRDACSRFPHHYGLQRMLVEWGRANDADAAEKAARDLLVLAPSDAWTRRELALILLQKNRPDEAQAEASEAARIEPRSTFSFSILGFVCQAKGQRSEARDFFRHAVELSVDNGEAMRALLNLAQTDTERKQELSFLERQLVQQVVSGDGLLAFLELAKPILAAEELLKSVRQAHSERPDLWHTWAALVSQLGHMGLLDEALGVAQEATGRFPHLPSTWLDLAQTHLWRKEPDAEIEAATQAFEINPAWVRSALALAGALERNGRLERALQIYERALHHLPQEPQLHAGRAHLLWQRRQAEAAFAAIEKALRLAPGYDWAWALLRTWATESGEASRADVLARALTRERSGEPYVWLQLAKALSAPEALTERLAAVDQALSLNARYTEAWDFKAELLALHERFDEALQACRQGEAACSQEVFSLRGRQAWVEAQRQKLPEAIRLMRAVLADNASYVWGWNQLAHWLVRQGAPSEAAEVFEQLLRLCPHDTWVNHQLGLLRLEQSDKSGAQKALAEVLRLNPADVAAAQNLFTLQLEANDLDGAAQTLQIMRTHQPGAPMLAAASLLQLRRKEYAAAEASLESLCRSPDPDEWPLGVVAEGFKSAGESSRALRALERALQIDPCNPQAGAATVRLLLALQKDFAATRFFLRLRPGELQRRAAEPLIQGLAKMRSDLLFRWLLWRRRDVLICDTAAWAQVGFGLVSFNRMGAAARWLEDWRSRPDVQPWVLFNLCLALRHLGRYDEAYAVAKHVAETWGHRQGAEDFHLFLAVEEALRGALPQAASHLQHAKIRELLDYDQDLLALVKALVTFQKAPPEERALRFREVSDTLGRRFTASYVLGVTKDVRRTFRRAAEVFIREGGGWRARLWFGWRLGEWVRVPALVVFLAVISAHPFLIVMMLTYYFILRKHR